MSHRTEPGLGRGAGGVGHPGPFPRVLLLKSGPAVGAGETQRGPRAPPPGMTGHRSPHPEPDPGDRDRNNTLCQPGSHRERTCPASPVSQVARGGGVQFMPLRNSKPFNYYEALDMQNHVEANHLSVMSRNREQPQTSGGRPRPAWLPRVAPPHGDTCPPGAGRGGAAADRTPGRACSPPRGRPFAFC